MWSEARHLANQEFPQGMTGAIVNGAFVELELGADFTRTVMELANQAGLGKFRVFLNDEELDQDDDLPDVIMDGMQLKVIPYDEAG